MKAYSVDYGTEDAAILRVAVEKNRRRYAAVEAAKLGHGGVEYIAQVLACDPKTIRQGFRDLDQAEDAAAGRCKKGGDARRA